jgi:hypothetical protein
VSRLRIALVAPEDQNVAGRQLSSVTIRERQLFFRQERRHAVGGPKPIADIGHIVDPVRAVLVGNAFVPVLLFWIAVVISLLEAVLGRNTVRGCLHEALVGVFAKHGCNDVANADTNQHTRVVPAHCPGRRLFLQTPHDFVSVTQHDASPRQNQGLRRERSGAGKH